MNQQLKPKRCPYLEGAYHSRRFESGKDKRQFDFRCQLSNVLFNAMSGYPEQKGCLNGEYTKCGDYSERTFNLLLTIPPLCPLIVNEDECEITGESCSEYWIDYKNDIESEDYRKCTTFSKWFWEKASESAKR